MYTGLFRPRHFGRSGTADDRLGLWDFADPKLVFGFAVAVPRYLLSTALKVGGSFLRSEFWWKLVQEYYIPGVGQFGRFGNTYYRQMQGKFKNHAYFIIYIICSVWWQVLEFGVLIFVCGASGANTDSVRNWSLHFLQRAGVLGHSGRPLVRGSGLMAEYLSFNDSFWWDDVGKGAAKGNPVISRHHSAYKLPNEIILSMQRLVSNRGDGSLADHPLLLGDLTSDSERQTCTSRYLK